MSVCFIVWHPSVVCPYAPFYKFTRKNFSCSYCSPHSNETLPLGTNFIGACPFVLSSGIRLLSARVSFCTSLLARLNHAIFLLSTFNWNFTSWNQLLGVYPFVLSSGIRLLSVRMSSCSSLLAKLTHAYFALRIQLKLYILEPIILVHFRLLYRPASVYCLSSILL